MEAMLEKPADVAAVESSDDLERVRERFRLWREGRKQGARIPKELWQAAVALSPRHSYHQISSALRLDYVDVWRHAERGSVATRKRTEESTKTAFVELRMPRSTVSALGECRLRAEDGQGHKVELELKGVGVEDLLRLL